MAQRLGKRMANSFRSDGSCRQRSRSPAAPTVAELQLRFNALRAPAFEESWEDLTKRVIDALGLKALAATAIYKEGPSRKQIFLLRGLPYEDSSLCELLVETEVLVNDYRGEQLWKWVCEELAPGVYRKEGLTVYNVTVR